MNILSKTFAFKAPIKDLPSLALPPMYRGAREAFRFLMQVEEPSGYGAMSHILLLAQARGFSTHPEDWRPGPEHDRMDHTPLYQPWADWLAENGHIPYYEGVTLTSQNWSWWKPGALARGFKRAHDQDPIAANKLLLELSDKTSASVRFVLLKALIEKTSALYPMDIPMVRHFADDRSRKVAALAGDALSQLNGMETTADHAQEIARHYAYKDGAIAQVKPSARLISHFLSTTYDDLADVFGVDGTELAHRWSMPGDNTELNGDLFQLARKAGESRNLAAKEALASRMLNAEKEIPAILLAGLDRSFQDRWLQLTLRNDPWSLPKCLGDNLGSLPLTTVHVAFPTYETSVIAELKDGTLPVNKYYDPLRMIGIVADADAAKSVIDRAVSLGMSPDSPRLAMLHYNAALAT